MPTTTPQGWDGAERVRPAAVRVAPGRRHAPLTTQWAVVEHHAVAAVTLPSGHNRGETVTPPP